MSLTWEQRQIQELWCGIIIPPSSSIPSFPSSFPSLLSFFPPFPPLYFLEGPSL